MKTFDVRDFGAVGDGRTLDTPALGAAARACRDAGGGTLRFSPGVYLTGTFEIFAHTTVHLERGATLLDSLRVEDHEFEGVRGGVLLARDADGITLEGEGVIDGNAPAFFDETAPHVLTDFDPARTRQGSAFAVSGDLVHGPLKPRQRPGNLVVLAGCTNVRIENLRITGSAYWTLHLADCVGVTIRNLAICNDPRHGNNDGVHLTSCRRVIVEDCLIVCGDDAVAITGFREHGGECEIALGLRGRVGVCEDITVRRCRLSSRSAAVRIGYGKNPTRRVTLEDLELFDCNRGIGIFAREASVEDVCVRRVRLETRLFRGRWWGAAEPVHVSAVRFHREQELPAVRRVTVEDLSGVAENGICLFAEEPGAVADVTLRRITLEFRVGPLFEILGGNLDLRPAADHAIAIHAGGTAPVWTHGVRGLRLEDFQAVISPSAEGIFQSGVR